MNGKPNRPPEPRPRPGGLLVPLVLGLLALALLALVVAVIGAAVGLWPLA